MPALRIGDSCPRSPDRGANVTFRVGSFDTTRRRAGEPVHPIGVWRAAAAGETLSAPDLLRRQRCTVSDTTAMPTLTAAMLTPSRTPERQAETRRREEVR